MFLRKIFTRSATAAATESGLYRGFCQKTSLNVVRLREEKLQYYALSGKGKHLVVLLHGGPGSHKDFRHLVPHFENKARILQLDLPGYAQTPAESARDATNAALADTVLELLDTLGLQENLILIGHSLGGHLAMELASRCPEKINGIALLCSAGLRPHQCVRPFYLTRLTAKWLNNSFLYAVFAPISLFVFKKFLGFPASTTQSDVVSAHKRIGLTDFDNLRVNVVPKISKTPALICWSKDDPMIETNIPEELCDSFRDCFSHEFLTGGHNIQKTQAQEVAKMVIDLFVDSSK